MRPWYSIARLMVVVAVIALNAGLIRDFVVSETNGLVLIAMAFQVGLYLAIRGRTSRRPFLWGFVATCPSILLFFILAEFSGRGELVTSAHNAYLESAFNVTASLCERIPDPATGAKVWLLVLQDMQQCVIEVLLFVPQLILAVAGGLIIALAVGRLGRHSSSDAAPVPA